MTSDRNRRVLSPEWVVPRRHDAGLNAELGQGWRVIPAPLARGAAYTDFTHNSIAVPMGDTEAEKAVRLHEFIHAGLSPVEVPNGLLDLVGISQQAIRLAEEVRVNFVAGQMMNYGEGDIGGNIEHLSDGSELALSDRICTDLAWNDALHLLLSTHNTAMYKRVKRRLRRVKHWRAPIAEIEAHLMRRGLTAGNTLSGAAYVRAVRTDPVVYRWVDKKGAERETMLNDGFTSITLPLATEIDEWLAHPPCPPGTAMPREREIVPTSDGWAELRIGATRLTESTTSFIGRRKRPAMTGKNPVRPDRLLTDPERRIFRETVRSSGGVVVFDCSGSMGVTHETVRNAVRQFAGATVMVYSDRSRMNAANAWVVARNGRMISETDFDDLPLHSGNGVDGPALRWALKQRKTPKDFVLWVSDGAVTGAHDRTSYELLGEVANLSRVHNIIGVDTCEEAVDLLRSMKNGGYTPRRRYCRVVTEWIQHRETGERIQRRGHR